MTEAPLLALHQSHGYRLYQVDGRPFVVRTWTKYRKDANGDRIAERQEMRLELISDHFAGTRQSREVFAELQEAWDLWQSWNTANNDVKEKP